MENFAFYAFGGVMLINIWHSRAWDWGWSLSISICMSNSGHNVENVGTFNSESYQWKTS